MASNDLKGQNFNCKFLRPPSIVIVDQEGVFFVHNRLVLLWQLLFLWKIGFVVASVVFVEDWFCCGKCCYSKRLVLLWQVLFLWKIGFAVASVVILED